MSQCYHKRVHANFCTQLKLFHLQPYFAAINYFLVTSAAFQRNVRLRTETFSGLMGAFSEYGSSVMIHFPRFVYDGEGLYSYALKFLSQGPF